MRYNKIVRWLLVRIPFKWKWLTDYLYPDDAMVTFNERYDYGKVQKHSRISKRI